MPAKRGAMKPPGEWNEKEITAQEQHIRVVVNGKTIVDTDLNDITDPLAIMKHPGLLRERGHIGFLGHNDYIAFRNCHQRKRRTRHRKVLSRCSTVRICQAGKDCWRGRTIIRPIARSCRPINSPRSKPGRTNKWSSIGE